MAAHDPRGEYASTHSGATDNLEGSYPTVHERAGAKRPGGTPCGDDLCRLVFERTGTAVVVVRADSTFRAVNPAAERVLGLPQCRLAGTRTLLDFVAPDYRDDFARWLASWATGEGAAWEERELALVDARGRRLRFFATLCPVVETGDCVITLVNLDELRLARDNVCGEHGLAERLMETSPACVLVCDCAGAVVFANPETERVLGIAREDIVGRNHREAWTMFDVRGERELARSENPVSRVLDTGAAQYGVNVSISTGRGRKVVCVSAAPLFGEGERVQQVVATLEDVTDRMLSEVRLREQEERYRSLFDCSLDMVILADLDGTFIDANPAALRLLDRTREDICGQSVLTVVAERDRGIARATLRSLLQGGIPNGLVELHLVRKNGREVVVELRPTLVFREGRPWAVEAIGRDTTERMLQQQERHQSAVRLQRALSATIEAMSAAVETRDPYTAGHQRRVTQLARAIARKLQMDESSVEAVTMAGQVHDLGKLRVPAEILSKPCMLSEAEYEMIKEHPLSGYEILANIEFPWPVAEMVYQHHERLDGSGYPRGLCGGAILAEARVLAVADVFEAMSSHRPYRAALGRDAALVELERGAGTVYDAAAVRACLSLVRHDGFRFR